MRELDKVLDPQEKVLWEGKPGFWPFVLGGSIATTLFGIVWMIFLTPFIGMAIYDILYGSKIYGFGILLLPHFWVGIGFVFGIPIYQFLVFKYTHYAITDKRAIIQKGLIGRDFELVDFDQITNIEVNVGILDKIVGTKDTGSIMISTAGSVVLNNKGNAVNRPHTFRNIKDPYEVFKFFKKVSHDVRTDISFPNKMRPTENPGYQTNYTQTDIK